MSKARSSIGTEIRFFWINLLKKVKSHFNKELNMFFIAIYVTAMYIFNTQLHLDPDIVEALKPWKEEVDKMSLRKIGNTRVLLDKNCYYEECNIGNLLTDAMVDAVCNL